MNKLERIGFLVSEQVVVVASIKYAMRRTVVTMEMRIVLREESQKLNDLLALEQEERRRLNNEEV
jgi:hypothetical protein